MFSLEARFQAWRGEVDLDPLAALDLLIRVELGAIVGGEGMRTGRASVLSSEVVCHRVSWTSDPQHGPYAPQAALVLDDRCRSWFA